MFEEIQSFREKLKQGRACLGVGITFSDKNRQR